MNRRRVAVTIRLMAESYGRLHWSCTACESLCEHVGAAFSLILDEKMALGLSAPPPERVPVESLSEEELLKRAIEERWERARAERMTVQSADPDQPWTDYTVTSKISGKTYRVAVRGLHARRVVLLVPRLPHEHTRDVQAHPARPCEAEAAVHGRAIEAAVQAQDDRRSRAVRRRAALRLLLPENSIRRPPKSSVSCAAATSTTCRTCSSESRISSGAGGQSTSTPTRRNSSSSGSCSTRIARRVAEIRRQPESHPLRRELLKAELLPYQLDGIAFAAGAGRAVLADDMGLGKTIQGVGVAELLAREAGIRRCSSSARRRSNRSGGTKSSASATRDCQLDLRRHRVARRAVRQRLLLHRLQLRAGAARHPVHRAA